MTAIIILGAIFLHRAELCRYPQFSLTEEYTFRIDLEQEGLQAWDVTKNGWVSTTNVDFSLDKYLVGELKRTQFRGSRINTLTVDSGYGTYVIKGDPNLEENTLKIAVDNRSIDGSRDNLLGITSIKVFPIEVTQGVGKDETTEVWYDITLTSGTNNRNSGLNPCTRVDYVITIPAACLLDETKINIKAPKSQVRMEESTFDATLKEFKVKQDLGWIDVDGVSAHRCDLSTGDGQISVDKASAHVLFLQGKVDGAVIQARNVSLFSSDSECEMISVYTEGFPQEEAYRKDVMKCKVEPGKLTVDSEGAENGGDPAVALTDIRGGSIATSVRLGKQTLTTRACDGFTGEFQLITPSGKVGISKKAAPANALIVLPNSNFTTLKPVSGSAEEVQWLAAMEAVMPGYDWPDPWIHFEASNQGSICINYTAFQQEQLEDHVIRMEALTVGDLQVEFEEPYLGTLQFD